VRGLGPSGCAVPEATISTEALVAAGASPMIGHLPTRGSKGLDRLEEIPSFPPRSRWCPRTLLCLITLTATLYLTAPPRKAAGQSGKPVLHVFLQLDVKSSTVEKALQEHLPELSVTAFDRYRDFEEGLGNGRPDALLAIPPVLAKSGLSPTLQGQRGGKKTEPYLLASVNHPLDGPLDGKTIGVLDILGRDDTRTLVEQLLNATNIKIKRVAKAEDLLPLLEFSAADGIALPPSLLDRMLERTQLPMKYRELSGEPVGLCALAVLNPTFRDTIVKSFENLDGPTRHLLGIESWSIP
jgi:hypothetical protein